MMTNEEILANAKKINLVFAFAAKGEPFVLVAKTDIEEQYFFTKTKELLTLQNVPHTEIVENNLPRKFKLQNGELIEFIVDGKSYDYPASPEPTSFEPKVTATSTDIEKWTDPKPAEAKEEKTNPFPGQELQSILNNTVQPQSGLDALESPAIITSVPAPTQRNQQKRK